MQRIFHVLIEVLRALYHDFFFLLYTLIKTSEFTAHCLSKVQSGYFFHNCFTTQRLLKKIGIVNEIIYFKTIVIVQLSSGKHLGNKRGAYNATRMLSVFFESEKLCASILENICSVLNTQFLQPTLEKLPRHSTLPSTLSICATISTHQIIPTLLRRVTHFHQTLKVGSNRITVWFIHIQSHVLNFFSGK